MTENEPLLQNAQSPEYPKKRWILLLEFCALAFLQSSIFLSWNPIANSALFAFQWTDSTLAWQINLATITSPFIQYPVWKYLKRFNLAKTIRWLAVFPLVIGSFLCALPSVIGDINHDAYKWLTYLAYGFIGLTGVVFFSCVTRFSSTWFPPGERATSTGLSCMMANLGGILPSILGPQIVTDPFKDPNASQISIAKEIYLNMLVYFVLSLVLFLIFWLHFPDNENYEEQPDLNHSVKSECIKVLSSNTAVLILLVASFGSIPHVWGSTLLTVTLSKLKIAQEFIGFMITLSLIASTIFTLILSRCADVYFAQNLKNLIMALLPLHAIAMIFMSVFVLTGTPESNHQYLIGLFFVVGIGILNSVSPLILELGSEVTHPVSEDIMAGIINQANNLVGVIFLLLFSYLSSKDWLLYLLMSLPVATLTMFSMTNEVYNRIN